jgi:hypothetical protein
MSTNTSDFKEVLRKIVKNLPKRSQDVIVRRFGINKKRKETLESIGHTYGITRERVRQIEEEGLRRLRSKENISIIKPILDDLELFISERGGLMREDRLLEEFVEYIDSDLDRTKYRGFTLLLLNLGINFKLAKENAKFYPLWYTQSKALDQARSLINELVVLFKKSKLPFQEKDAVAKLKKNFPFFSRQAIGSYIDASKQVDSNIYNDLGLSDWPEINPRGVRDKAYLVVKKLGNPLHFRAIADEINKAKFSRHIAKPQTVHNELIKDSRFVLVGRGLYALTEWGYSRGTVKDILIKIFKQNKDKILPEKKLIELVLKERFVKEATIRFNLRSNAEFVEKTPGKYILKEKK